VPAHKKTFFSSPLMLGTNKLECLSLTSFFQAGLILAGAYDAPLGSASALSANVRLA
jgi:hypothetical protein